MTTPSTSNTPDPPTVPVLALRPADAAKAIGLGTRAFWTLTASGEIPVVRVGRAVLIPVDGLRAWLTARTEGGAV
jgi:excisionase family DNA binding protein